MAERSSVHLLSKTTFFSEGPLIEPLEDKESLFALTILYHPDLSRIGERACFQLRGQEIPISRISVFRPLSRGKPERALEDLGVSRTPCVLTLHDNGGVSCIDDRGKLLIRSDGALQRASQAGHEEVVQGRVMFELSNRMLFQVHLVEQRDSDADDLGMLGTSDELRQLRETILRYAPLLSPTAKPPPASILIRGESGTGKELVARALFERSGPRGRPFIRVNGASLTEELAPALLFGHTRGTFTGAVRDAAGFFGEAAGGVLFLDEIGECPLSAQALLLRVVENGEIVPVGQARPRESRAALIFATDADLEGAVEQRRFNNPLFQRITRLTITVPPLRKRREDIPVLFHHFLRAELQRLGKDHLLRGQQRQPWLPLDIVRDLVARDWLNSNIRGVQRLAFHIAYDHHDKPQVSLSDVNILLDNSKTSLIINKTTHDRSAMSPEAEEKPKTDTYHDAFEEHGYNIKKTAAALKVSENTFRKWLKQQGILKSSQELTPDEVASARKEVGDDLAQLARHLRVSEHGLKMRLTHLGIKL